MSHLFKSKGRITLAVIAVFAAIIQILPVEAQQYAPATTQTYKVSGSISSPVTAAQSPAIVNLNGSNSCAITLSGTWTGSVGVYKSNDYTTYSVDTNFNGGVPITTNGETDGTIAGKSLGQIALAFSPTSGTINYVLLCSPSNAGGSGSGGGGGTYTAPPVQVVAPQPSGSAFPVVVISGIPAPQQTAVPNADGGAPVHVNNTSIPVAPAPGVTFGVHSVDPTPTPIPSTGIPVYQTTTVPVHSVDPTPTPVPTGGAPVQVISQPAPIYTAVQSVHSVDATPTPTVTNADGGAPSHITNTTAVPVAITSSVPFTGNLSAPYSGLVQGNTPQANSFFGASGIVVTSSPTPLSAGQVGNIALDPFDNQMVNVAAFIASLPTGANSIGTVGLNAGANLIGSTGLKKTSAIETITVLAGSATYTGSWHDSTASADNPTTVNAVAYAVGGSGTSYTIQETNDTSLPGFNTVSSYGAVPASTYTKLTAVITARYWRIVYVNNTGAQTTFEIAYTTSSALPNTYDAIGNQKVGLYTASGAGIANTSTTGDANPGVSTALHVFAPIFASNGSTFDRLRTSQAIQGTGIGRLATSICDPTSAYCAFVDSTGNQKASVCGPGTTNCATVANGSAAEASSAFGLYGINSGMTYTPGSSTFEFNIGDLKVGQGTYGSIPLTSVGGSLATTLTSASATTCTAIETNTSGRLVSLINASTASQTVTLSIYNEGASPTCATADLIYSVVLAASDNRILNIPVTAGLAYTLSAAATNNIIITRNYHDLLKHIGFRNIYQAMRELEPRNIFSSN